ncbi:hypothetical protein ABPG74_012960 [Tetrahymena malaccensis]
MNQERELTSQELREIFDRDNFDPIQYINNRFPDENSLCHLDNEIAMLKEELQAMNEDLVQSIHNHALTNTQLQNEIKVAHETTKDVIQQIQIIKEKAEKSEELVFDMCKDIKSLDTAKKNLTFSITALKKFIMMLNAVDKLRNSCIDKNYKEVANLISAFNELSTYIQKYQNIPQIQELYKEYDEIVYELKQQIKEDFEAFNNQSTTLTAQDMNEACTVVENLGLNFQKEVIDFVCKLCLNSYISAFSKPENQTLDQHERRFAWLTRNLMEFDKKWEGVFPEYWTISCKLIHEFCSLTFVSCVDALQKYSRNTEVKIFMLALSSTVSFEQKISKDMERKYKKYISEINSLQDAQNQDSNSQQIAELLKTKKDFVQTRLPNFKGAISKAFEQYLQPYSDLKKQDITSCINKAMYDDLIDENLKVFKSYLDLQGYIQNFINEAQSYGMNQLIIEMSRVVKHGLRFYAERLTQRMEQEYNNTIKSREHEHFQKFIGCTINTSEFWKENIIGLEDSIKSKLDIAYHDNLDIQNESNIFSDVINKGIEFYLQYIEWGTEANFNTITKLNWQQMEAIDVACDSNDCVKEIKNFILHHIETIRTQFSEVYLFFYLKKLALQINQKFLNTVYKLRSLGEGAVPQLMVDATELETSLIDLAKSEEQQSKTIQNYVNNVKKSFNKTKNILKLLNMPNQGFIDNFTNFFEDATVIDLEKLLLVKGIKKTEVPQLFKVVGNK